MIRLGGLIDLSHGGLCEFATSDMNTSELCNHEQLESKLRKGEVFIADRLYSGYELIERLSAKGIHFIGRIHQATSASQTQYCKALHTRLQAITEKSPDLLGVILKEGKV